MHVVEFTYFGTMHPTVSLVAIAEQFHVGLWGAPCNKRNKAIDKFNVALTTFLDSLFFFYPIMKQKIGVYFITCFGCLTNFSPSPQRSLTGWSLFLFFSLSLLSFTRVPPFFKAIPYPLPLPLYEYFFLKATMCILIDKSHSYPATPVKRLTRSLCIIGSLYFYILYGIKKNFPSYFKCS